MIACAGHNAGRSSQLTAAIVGHILRLSFTYLAPTQPPHDAVALA